MLQIVFQGGLANATSYRGGRWGRRSRRVITWTDWPGWRWTRQGSRLGASGGVHVRSGSRGPWEGNVGVGITLRRWNSRCRRGSGLGWLHDGRHAGVGLPVGHRAPLPTGFTSCNITIIGKMKYACITQQAAGAATLVWSAIAT